MSESDPKPSTQGASRPHDTGQRSHPDRTRGDTGRDLLFGLLAFQNNFIDRAALLDGFNRWMVDRSRALGSILVESGALSTARHAVLEALVAEHIELHDSDPQKSLAVLGPIDSVREDLARIADADLTTSLAEVSAARGLDDDPDRTASFAGASTSAGARFRVLRPHARGGLGEVFIALDTELNRDVALKEIQTQFADDPRYRARFEFEAEVTGGLEHPGVVPVYGLGHTPDGRPFYAMRFIRGESLKEAVRRFHEAEAQPGRDPSQRTLELRELLGRFMDVCDAVAYAHSRSVLHRDLKPGNIMLGPYGETLVVDWGLAKALDRSEPPGPADHVELPLRPTSGSQLEPTLAGSAIGTPGFMSPEQAAGRVDRLGPQSDVYGLGATFYYLLTGRTHCEASDIGEALRKIQAGDIRRPRSLNPQVAPALEAICLKAMALDPCDRYGSVTELKTDLERWLADEPVSAWPDPLPTRLFRWGRRHRLMISAAAACVLTAIVSLWVASSRLQKEHARAELQSRILGNYMLAAEALVEMVDVIAGSSGTDGATGPGAPPPRAAPNPSTIAPARMNPQLAVLHRQFSDIKSRLESQGQHQMVRRLEEIIKRYDNQFRHEFAAAAGPGFGGSLGGSSTPFSLIGD